MSRLAVDPRPSPPRVSTPHLHRPLQPRAPAPRARPAPARLDKRGPATEPRRDQAPRPTRRTNPRIPPRRRMTRHFGTPHLHRKPLRVAAATALRGRHPIPPAPAAPPGEGAVQLRGDRACVLTVGIGPRERELQLDSEPTSAPAAASANQAGGVPECTTADLPAAGRRGSFDHHGLVPMSL
jgi:hypothetical protein